MRATLPAFVHQAGNFLASCNGPLQARIAEAHGGDYGFALALVGGGVAVVLIIVVRFSPQRRGEALTAHWPRLHAFPAGAEKECSIRNWPWRSPRAV